MHYKHLNEAKPVISRKVISGTLKRIEEDKLIVRNAYADVPPG